MQVAQYTYQSPSSNAVQVGKLDPSSIKEEKTSSLQQESKSKTHNNVPPQMQEVKSAITANSIDLYA